MTTENNYDDVDLTVFTLVCAECDAGDHISSYEQALAEGWTRISYAPDSPMANYVGMCPVCRDYLATHDEDGNPIAES
jgi:hypothetical protein